MTGLAVRPKCDSLRQRLSLLADGRSPRLLPAIEWPRWCRHPVAWGVVLFGRGVVADVAAWRGQGTATSARCWALRRWGVWPRSCCRWARGAATLVFWILRRSPSWSAAVCTVTFRSPVYCAVWFAMTLTGTAGIFMVQGAQFLAVATIVVYAGAILVTFLFVLMLASPEGDAYYDRVSWEAMLAAVDGRGAGWNFVDDRRQAESRPSDACDRQRRRSRQRRAFARSRGPTWAANCSAGI